MEEKRKNLKKFQVFQENASLFCKKTLKKLLKRRKIKSSPQKCVILIGHKFQKSFEQFFRVMA